MNKFLPYLNVFGYQPSSTKDYPKKIAAVLFLKFCNMACPFCHNFDNMVKLPPLGQAQLKQIINKTIFNKLTDAITVTGGEPTLQGDMVINLLKYYRRTTTKLLKVDTNGTNPIVLNELIKNKLVDFVSMDVKGSFEKYKERFSYTGDIDNLYKSAEILEKSNVAHEFRATVFPEFNADDMQFVSQFPNINADDMQCISHKLQEYKKVSNE